MKPDPGHDDYVRQWAEIYDAGNYERGLAAYFLRKSHEWCERPFGPDHHFPKVLEVGAGTGMHLRYVRHSYDEYWVTDLNPPMLNQLRYPPPGTTRDRIHPQREDATALSFQDGIFDRVIAAHVLEHLYRPHEVLREWARVLKPGGTLSLLLPCDPGVAWRAGRYLSARRKFIRAGLDYDYWMAREHVNPINCLVSLIRYYFHDFRENWFPARIPSIDINLFYIVHIRT